MQHGAELQSGLQSITEWKNRLFSMVWKVLCAYCSATITDRCNSIAYIVSLWLLKAHDLVWLGSLYITGGSLLLVQKWPSYNEALGPLQLGRFCISSKLPPVLQQLCKVDGLSFCTLGVHCCWTNLHKAPFELRHVVCLDWHSNR